MNLNSFIIPIIAVSIKTNNIVFINDNAKTLLPSNFIDIMNKDYKSIFRKWSISYQKDIEYIENNNNPYFYFNQIIFNDAIEDIMILKIEKVDSPNIQDKIKEDNFWKQIVQKMPIVVYINEYKPIWVNNHCKKVIGYTPEEYLNKIDDWLLKEFIHPDDINKFYDNQFDFEQFKDNEINTIAIEYRVKHKDGRWIWTRSHYFPIGFDSNNNLNLLIGTSEDISDRKELEFQLQNKIEELDEALKLAEKYHKESILQEQKVYQEKLNSMQIILDRTKMQLVLFSNFIENKKIYDINIRNKIIELSSYLSENYKPFNIEKEFGFQNNLQAIYDGIDEILCSTQFIHNNLDNNNINQLTIKELKVLSLLQLTLQTKEIANLLNVSVRTIETHVYNIRKKLNIPQKQTIKQYLFNIVNSNNLTLPSEKTTIQ